MITCRSPQEIAKIRNSAQLAAATLQHIAPMIQPGISTAELDRAAETYIRKQGGLPAFKGYRGFPATLCTSINAEVVHGIPSKQRKLAEGDIIGNYLSDISHAIQVFAEQRCYSVVKVFVGHGIGTTLHEEPQVPNFGPPRRGPRLRAGMVLALEPMVNAGTADVRILQDNWTVVTADGRLSAHFEHTITVAEYGGIILSQL